MNIGDYVRTYSGDIVQISENERRAFIDFKNKIGMFYEPEKTIKKSSPNIIDLIEVGDYVLIDDRLQLVEKSFCGDYLFVKRITTNNEIRVTTLERLFYENTIKEILTYQQCENNCYRIERK